MFLVRLVYVSTVSRTLSTEDIDQIISKAREHNSKNAVTGLLCFSSRYFLQCLEGSREMVNQTYHKILNDPRHKNIVMLEYTDINSREFDSWWMGYMPESSLTEPINLKYSGTKDFSPYEMSGESAHNLMLALRNTVPVSN